MYIRFCQPPQDLWAWMEPYLVGVSDLYFCIHVYELTKVRYLKYSCEFLIVIVSKV